MNVVVETLTGGGQPGWTGKGNVLQYHGNDCCTREFWEILNNCISIANFALVNHSAL